MSQTQTKSKSWPTIGTVRKNDADRGGGSYLKLEPNVTILVDGKEVPLNASRTLSFEDPRQKLQFFLENGHITEEQYDQRMEKLNEATWLKYNVVAAPPKKKGKN